MTILYTVVAFVCGILSVMLFLGARYSMSSRKRTSRQRPSSGNIHEKHTTFVTHEKNTAPNRSKTNLGVMRSPNSSMTSLPRSNSGRILNRSASRSRSPSQGDIALAVLSHRESSDYTGSEPLTQVTESDFGHYDHGETISNPDFDKI